MSIFRTQEDEKQKKRKKKFSRKEAGFKPKTFMEGTALRKYMDKSIGTVKGRDK